MTHREIQALPVLLREFLFYIEGIKGKSKLTVQEYYTDLRTFFRYLLMMRGLNLSADGTPLVFEDIALNDDNVNLALLSDVTLTDLHAFLVYCKNERNNNEATRARKTCVLRVFFRYLSVRTGQLSHNPADQLEAPKPRKSLPKHLTLEQSRALLSSVEGEYAARDFSILTLFLNCGLRLSELCGLNITDISSDNTMRITGKGSKQRIVYLNESCLSALNDYLKIRPAEGVTADHKDALFLSRLKRRIGRQAVQDVVYHALERAGLGDSGFSAHKLRHTAATLMYQHGGVDIRVLKDVLGHENLSTTQIYTHLSNQQVADAIQRNPLNVNKEKNNAPS